MVLVIIQTGIVCQHLTLPIATMTDNSQSNATLRSTMAVISAPLEKRSHKACLIRFALRSSLSLTVISAIGDLEDRWPTNVVCRRDNFACTGDRSPGNGQDAGGAKRRLFTDSVLRTFRAKQFGATATRSESQITDASGSCSRS